MERAGSHLGQTSPGGALRWFIHAMSRIPVPTVGYRSILRAMGRGIGPRLLALILLFSSVVALLSTMVQLYADYRRDVGAIEGRLDEVGRGYLNTLATGLWHVNVELLRVQLDGIMRLPDLHGLELRETPLGIARPLVIKAGQPIGSGALRREYPLVYDDRGVSRTVGLLIAEATLTGVYDRLTYKALVILATQLVKTFLVSLFTLYIVYRLVTRHLVVISEFLDRFDINQANGPRLALRRTRPPRPDEFDRMVGSFNAMCETLRANYHALLEAKEAMARDLAARRLAEAEVMRLNGRLESKVRQRTAELEAVNKELRAFSYSVSHDLRAPLRRIEGFGRMLAETHADRLDESGAHYLNRMRAGAHDMSEMIDGFLVLARAAHGDLEVRSVDLSARARVIVDGLRDKEPDREVAVAVADDLTADGDPRLLDQVLGNLLENAWKYTRGAAAPSIVFEAEEDGEGRRVFVVRDTGAGFDMAESDGLFAPFTRLHRAEEFEGTGIGLATVKSILTRHGGRIWADAEVGRGAAFRFTLWEEGMPT